VIAIKKRRQPQEVLTQPLAATKAEKVSRNPSSRLAPLNGYAETRKAQKSQKKESTEKPFGVRRLFSRGGSARRRFCQPGQV
jgi:hypothetical protein